MQTRPLGQSGLSIAPLMLGGNVFGWTADKSASFRVLDAFVDAGFNAVDTADCYSLWAPGNVGGESETIIGDWLRSRGRRNDVVIATKVGWELAPDRKGLSARWIRQAAEESLRRLGIDCIDLYQSHVDDTTIPFEETLSAYQQLIEQGKVRAIGCSNISAVRLEEALAVSRRETLPRYESVQPKYNLYDRREVEADLKAVVESQGLGVISFYGLAAGFLTGKYRSQDDLAKSPRGARAAGYLNTRGLKLLGVLDEVSAAVGATPAQVALAWIMAKPFITAPIASATSVEQLNELVKAADLRLDPAAMAALDAASA
ncbi:MAG: aldo/keto reductase [Caulobacteraceae bacterium]|nr:aldo/keto reductase [Caulobacteraceae bacterium]